MFPRTRRPPRLSAGAEIAYNNQLASDRLAPPSLTRAEPPGGVPGKWPPSTTARPRRPARPTTGADVLVESLVRHGVEVVFAYPGGASMPMHQALTRYTRPDPHDPAAPRAGRRLRGRGLRPHHRQGRASCMATSGPGRLNLVTGLADAKMDSLPIDRHHRPGAAPTSSAPTRSRKRRWSRSAGRSPSTTTWCSDAEDIARVVKEAFHIATHRPARPGPDRHAQGRPEHARADPDYDVADGPARLPPAAARPRRADRSRSSAAIKASKQPIIYAGGGIIAAGRRRRSCASSPRRPASPSP